MLLGLFKLAGLGGGTPINPNDIRVRPGFASLTATGLSPTVIVAGSSQVIVAPGFSALTATGFAPTISVSSGFNPTSLFTASEQGVIYDWTDTATMFQERTGASATTPSGANGPIGSLKDLSPNGNYAISPTDSTRPLSRQGVGAPNVYGETDGIDDRLVSTFTITQTIVRISSFRIITSVNGNHLYNGATSNIVALFTPTANGLQIYAGGQFGTLTASNGEDLVVTERYNGASSRIAKNNSAYITGNAGNMAPPGGITIGSIQGGSGNSSLRLYRLIEINRDLTDPEVASCRTWCGQPAGLSL